MSSVKLTLKLEKFDFSFKQGQTIHNLQIATFWDVYILYIYPFSPPYVYIYMYKEREREREGEKERET